MKKTYRTILISDVHLGSSDSRAEELSHFLKNNSCEQLYLVGDIIDGWKIQRNKWKWKQSHSQVIKRVLQHAKHNTKVVYVAGNHDEFLRPLIPHGFGFANIEVVNQTDFISLNGSKFLVTHGDLFDGITRLSPWLSFLGDKAYDVVLSLNRKFNWIRHRMGFGYWSLSKFLKRRVKKAVDFMFQFEKTITNYARKRKYDGVICGHIHHPEIKIIDGIIYKNCGDWVENCSALVENHDGSWKIIYWTQK